MAHRGCPCACVPNKIGDVTFAQDTILSGYQPPWIDDNSPAWEQNIGYQLAGFLGIGGLILLGFALYRLGRWLMPSAPPDWRTAT